MWLLCPHRGAKAPATPATPASGWEPIASVASSQAPSAGTEQASLVSIRSLLSLLPRTWMGNHSGLEGDVAVLTEVLRGSVSCVCARYCQGLSSLHGGGERGR